MRGGLGAVFVRAAEVGEAVDGGVGAVVAPRGQQGARGPVGQVRRRPLRTHFAARIEARSLGFTVLYLFDGGLGILNLTQPLKELLDRLGASTYDLLTLNGLDVFDEETQRGLKKFSGRRVQLPTSFWAMIDRKG